MTAEELSRASRDDPDSTVIAGFGASEESRGVDGDERGMYDQQAVCLLGLASPHEPDEQYQQDLGPSAPVTAV